MNSVKHSINLYLPRFRPPELSTAMMLLVKVSGLGFILLLITVSTLFLSQLYLSAQVDTAKLEQQALNDELVVVIAQLPNTVIDQNLVLRIEREKKLLEKQTRVISFLRQDSIKDSSSYTPLVEQLSQQSVKGIWLSKFEVINQGNDIQLHGFAKTPDQVSRYLTMLGTQPAYQGRAFKQIDINRGSQAWSEFFLSTQEQEVDEESLLQERITGAGL
jgi:Tfp pilus assembly protein PilN